MNTTTGGVTIQQAPTPTNVAPQANNQPSGDGNSQQQSAGGDSTTNNTSNGIDLNQFWSEPADGVPQGQPSNTPANPTPPAGDQQQQGNRQQPNQPANPAQAVAQQLGTILEGYRTPAIFNDQIATEIAEGNYEGLNNAFQQMQTQALQTGIRLAATLMQGMRTDMMSQIESMVDGRFSTRDKADTLESSFPELVQNPALRPQIEQVFEQSMRHTNNDRKKATSLARDMLKLMGTELNQSLNAPPPSYSDAGSRSLLEELMSTSQ